MLSGRPVGKHARNLKLAGQGDSGPRYSGRAGRPCVDPSRRTNGRILSSPCSAKRMRSDRSAVGNVADQRVQLELDVAGFDERHFAKYVTTCRVLYDGLRKSLWLSLDSPHQEHGPGLADRRAAVATRRGRADRNRCASAPGERLRLDQRHFPLHWSPAGTLHEDQRLTAVP